MKKMHYTDEEILEGIRKGSTVVLEHVYEDCYPLVRSLVLRNSGGLQDVQDVFQDAMVILLKQTKQRKLVAMKNSSFKTYLFSICNHLWLQKLEKRKVERSVFKKVGLTVEFSEEELIEIYDEEAEKYRIYQKHFIALSKECRKVMRLFLKKLTIREISVAMGYKTERYTKVKKHRCKESLKRRIINDPDYKSYKHYI